MAQMTTGQKVYAARKARGWSVQQLSNKSGVKWGVIRNCELDAHDTSFFNMCCIAKALDLSLDYLAGINQKGI